MNLKKFLEMIRFKINDAGEFMWECYGRNAFMIDSHRKSGSVSAVFDSKNQKIYEVRVYDYKNRKAYKYISTKFEKKHNKELKDRGFKQDQAWDDVEFEKASAAKIVNYLEQIASKKA